MIHKLKSNDREAYNELVALYKNSVINTCYRFLLDKQDAEDVSQDVFIEIFQSIHSFRGDAQLSTWVYRITVTKCLDEIKKRKRKKRFAALSKLLHIDDVGHWLAGGKMPDQSLQEHEKMDAIAQVLNRLPDNQRIAFTLCKLEGFSNPEIAEIMGITTIAVESLVYRAKKKAATHLEIILKK